MAGPGPGAALESPRQLLGRVRFLAEAAQSLRAGRPLPKALAFVPREVLYKLYKDPAGPSRVLLPVWEAEGLGLRVGAAGPAPGTGSGPLRAARDSIELRRGACVRTTGEELCNGHGLWVKLTKEQLAEHLGDCGLNEGWLLVCRPAEGGARLVPIDTPDHLQRQQQLFGVDYRPVLRWEQVVDLTYSHRLGSRPQPAEAYTEAVQRLLYVPPTWTYECDEDLIHFLYDHLGKEDENLGSVKQYVESIDVSSYTEEFNVSCLTDSNADTYWESDGSQCQHWVRLTMKKGTIVKKLLLTVDTTDDNFMPKRVVIYGGEGDNLKKLSDVSIDETLIGDVCVLEDMTVHLPVIEIRIVECRDDGIDVRLRGIKIKSSRQRELGLNADLFQPASLVRYPRLEGTDPEVLYRRAVLLQRFIKILDSVLHHLVPAWDHTLGTFSEIKQVKQFLLLSRQRPGLVAQCLRDSESSKPSFMPRLYINRRLAMEHRACPLRDPACKNAVFTQVYEGLKPSDKYEKPLDYRWPMRYDQWWECKFIAEGIIDQGGGFRDSLADMSEELCPSSADTPVPLPFFVRTANQGNGTGEARDMYVPNPSCRDFAKYEWIGQLMGAALRGKEFLVLALPGFVWKQLSGEEVSWSKDFPAVDSVLVKLLEVMEGMDKETFEFKFGKELTFTTVLSDQQVVELIPGGAGIIVGYEDRSRFIQLVQKTRLEESKEQVAAMQAGLLKVVPQAVLDLLTWQELEKKVCGDPEVTVDALRKLTRFEDFEPSDTRVQYFWEALNNFTNEDRSRFLRFVTGRSRLPARIYIYPDKLGYETTDALPESSTCSSTLFLPHYASDGRTSAPGADQVSVSLSAKVCEEKLRYAAYNCVAIDTDMSPWEE
ncbi:E3 ubiquitin-protein ligase HECTD3 isoform X2 [Acinonyx jubatus]|uniref:E3 ubiquitin-protein ligase HECTD3 isoform X2 n=1 Tax=Acinonyx jubatus TaxID=32536 RepID=A0A6J1ZCX7_ACIJB|nr:E3 ubiquitin-protein ligase HECTD3 isoform X2 [Acinonyx jubatus]